MAKKKKTEDLDVLCADIALATKGDVIDNIENVTYYIDTGSLALNYSCSGRFMGGGIPGGRLTEIYGPSSSSKSLIGSNLLFATQRIGGVAVLLDVENAVNKEFMRKASHLNLKQVLRYTPPTLEKCFHKMYTLIEAIRKRSKTIPIVIVYDSLTSSPCERELREIKLPDGYTEADFKRIVKAHRQPGEHARACSQELKKLNTVMEQNNATVVILNQTREKIGVMYGCASGRTKVLLADGTWMRIAKIVNQKLPVEVMSVDQKTGKVSPRKVVGWHKNGKLENGNKFLKFRFLREFDNGRGVMIMTPNHMIFVPDGDGGMKEVPASVVGVGERVVTVRPEWFGYDQWQLVYGSILGDGSVRRSEKSRYSANLRFCHGAAQEDYLLYKRSMLGELAGKVGYSKNGHVKSDSKSIPELSRLADYRKNYLIPQEVADKLDLLGLAIWYMDDGTYGGNHAKWGSGKSTIYAMKWKNREVMLPVLSKFGLEAQLTDKGFTFDADNTKKLHRMVARFCPPCMWYKLHESCHNLYDFQATSPQQRWESSCGIIESISHFDHARFAGDDIKYDITVDGNHTYIVGGAVVHNSPEQSGAGGNSLPFYASLRLRPQTQKKIEYTLVGKKKKCVGVNVKYRNVKNRTYRPFVEVEGIKLTFEKGINPISGLMLALLDAGRIQIDGKRYRVMDAYKPDGENVYFQTTLDANEVPLDVLLKCPQLIDADSKEQIEEYLAPFMGAVNYLNEEGVSETRVAEDEELEEDIEEEIEKALESEEHDGRVDSTSE